MRPRILCVDDEPLILASLRTQLREEYRVLGATDSASALQLLREEHDICVVLSDLRMGANDGVSFLAEARAVAPGIVTMLITGALYDAPLKETACRFGVHRILIKPCSTQELREAIRDGVVTYRSTRRD